MDIYHSLSQYSMAPQYPRRCRSGGRRPGRPAPLRTALDESKHVWQMVKRNELSSMEGIPLTKHTYIIINYILYI